MTKAIQEKSIPNDAKNTGIIEGDFVCLESPRGKIDLKATLTSEVKEGILSTTFHFPEVMVNLYYIGRNGYRSLLSRIQSSGS